MGLGPFPLRVSGGPHTRRDFCRVQTKPMWAALERPTLNWQTLLEFLDPRQQGFLLVERGALDLGISQLHVRGGPRAHRARCSRQMEPMNALAPVRQDVMT